MVYWVIRGGIARYWVHVGLVREDFSAAVASKIEKQRRVGQLNERSQSVCEENFQAKMELPGSMWTRWTKLLDKK